MVYGRAFVFTLQKILSRGCGRMDNSTRHERLKTETGAKRRRFLGRRGGLRVWAMVGPEAWATRSAVSKAGGAPHRRVGKRPPAQSPEGSRGQVPAPSRCGTRAAADTESH